MKLFMLIATLFALRIDALEMSAPRYYVVFFSINGRVVDKPTESHCFAAYIEVAQGKAPLVRSISWSSVDAKSGHYPLLRVTDGINRSLKETLQINQKTHKLSIDGPYEIKREVFAKALDQIHYLESGEVRYKLFDWRLRKRAFNRLPGAAINCQHVLSDFLGFMPQTETWGHSKTLEIISFYRSKGAFVNYPEVQRDVLAISGIEGLLGAVR